jgi:hypothetical protein
VKSIPPPEEVEVQEMKVHEVTVALARQDESLMALTHSSNRVSEMEKLSSAEEIEFAQSEKANLANAKVKATNMGDKFSKVGGKIRCEQSDGCWKWNQEQDG